MNQSKDMEEITMNLRRFSLENSENNQKSKINKLILQVQHEQEKIKLIEAENERMKKTIERLKKERMSKGKDKVDNEDIIDRKIVEKVEDILATKLEHMSETITQALKESIIPEMKLNNKEIEKKIEEVSIQENTYASALKSGNNTPWEKVKSQGNKIQLRTIVKEVKNEELVEENDKKRRSTNLIIHGLPELTSESDKLFVNKLIEETDSTAIPKVITRIGESDKKPLKVVFLSEKERNKILSNLGCLKDKEEYRGVSITEDFTKAERDSIKSYVKEAKKLNDDEPIDSQFVWKVRGTPKNGLRVKKLPKRKHSIT